MACKTVFKVLGLALALTMVSQGAMAKGFLGSVGVSGGVFACTPDSFETDNDFGTASLINVGDVQNRSICPAGDVDFAQFTLTDVTNVIVETSGDAGDTVLTLYDSTFKEVATDDDGGNGAFSLIKQPNLPAGIYYIKVEEYNNDNEIAAYTLSLQSCTPDCTGKVCGDDGCGGSCGECAANEQCNEHGQCEKLCDADSYEPDNDFTQAVVIGLAESQDHTICPPGDVDTLKFTLTDATAVTIETTGPADGDTKLVLFDAQGNQLAENDDKSSDNFYSKILIHLDPGDYFVQVTGYDENSIVASYTITLSVCTPQCDGKVCGDDGCGGECPPGCPGDQVCNAGQCVDPWPANCLGEAGPSAKTCPEGLTDVGCCDNGRVVFCYQEQLWCMDCALDGNVCGWYPGDWLYPPGYYCAPQEYLDPEDPSGQYPVHCPGAGPCTPNCEGKECGPDGCGGSCGDCQGGGLCVSYHCVAPYPQSCLGPQTPSAPSCPQDLSDIGCCDTGNRVVWCDQGKLYCADCPTNQQPELQTCGWQASAGYYDCGGQGEDPSGQNPLQCGFCMPFCFGKECGDDGCGGLCGTCQEGYTCNNGVCECVPKCQDKECGDDGCGGTCPPGCQEGQICVDWHCCTPNCQDKQCGDNGCGGTCGECQQGEVCIEGVCCAPKCEGKECGDDGCGGTCGECQQGEVCIEGVCCAPNCAGKQCGDDGCGGSCGSCGANETCKDGKCEPVCVPNCEGKQCGDNGCGGTCGTCAENQTCVDGQCQPVCVPNCENKECGDNGCGGSCGTCQEGYQCSTDGKCVATGGGGGGGGGCTAQGTSTNPVLFVVLGALSLFLAFRRRYN